ncbi:uncharacterized protein Z518_10812 [Rhinocladiella mackenziei CBS 650.93]|uniref:Uncharacterized protein n=1 Tax=Rhinocladiella mackenziei CBS 650.93 TaxID=1442369 RepID=A0A0D2IT30_9EURO|nr:uncharacterized protein Z518_10812 [Rhinocladiella mackenziei CBS 650.93]KIW99884.1 hypothetical protein Z518_10812 [Rhinocladiella mackenziei CBS 650.93]
MAPAILRNIAAVVAAKRIINSHPQSQIHSSSNSTPSDNITAAPDQPWGEVGPADTHLLPELKKLYWIGVRSELENILFALREWRKPEFADPDSIENEDDFIHGFDTFVDQVCQGSRAFARRYEERKRAKPNTNYHLPSYAAALHERGLDLKADRISSKIKQSLREEVQGTPLLEERVRLLLQSAGLLDIEKLIEHRPPLDGWQFWRRPGVPQLTLSRYTKDSIPIFSSAHCSTCNTVIRGPMFYSSTTPHDQLASTSSIPDWKICEACYLERYYGQPNVYKVHKHCVLDGSISPTSSRKICRCTRVPHSDKSGRYRTLFPINNDDKHVTTSRKGGLQCPLLSLGDAIAESKYDAMQTLVTKRIPLSEEKRRAQLNPAELEKLKQSESKGIRKKKKKKENDATLQVSTMPSLVDETDRIGTQGKSSEVREAEADEDIPFFMRRYIEKYPFGNVHMALRVGPLIIENGVAHTKGGALVTLRDPAQLSPSRDSRSLPPPYHVGYAIAEDSRRTVWSQSHRQRGRKRYKAIMKQIIGVPFTGILDRKIEDSIVQTLIAGSDMPFDDPGLSLADQRKLIDSILLELMPKVKRLLESRVDVYLTSISQRLIHQDTKLRWSPTKNSCQSFCDAILNWDHFGQFIPDNPPPYPLSPGSQSQSQSRPHPLYLISFATRPSSYTRNKIATKFDVPSGLTEEYLLKFRYGRHEEADIIDTLHEYWFDFAAFGKHLYPNQTLFPWDCTEAFGRYPTRCGDCNLSKHVWAFPFDSWSIISLHLGRDRWMYAPTRGEKLPLSDAEWFKNRLTLLHAQNLLLRVGAAMHRVPAFRTATKWLHTSEDTSVDRLKLGGIHRAQPFSHVFDQGLYHQYFIAEWAIRDLDERVRQYEELRDGRVRLKDVPGPRRVGESEAKRQRREMEEENYYSTGLRIQDWGPWTVLSMLEQII